MFGDSENRDQKDYSDPTGESIVEGYELGQDSIRYDAQSVHEDTNDHGTGSTRDEGNEDVVDPTTPTPEIPFTRFFSEGNESRPHRIR